MPQSYLENYYFFYDNFDERVRLQVGTYLNLRKNDVKYVSTEMNSSKYNRVLVSESY